MTFLDHGLTKYLT